jgi:hypothetical protein
LLHQIRVIFLPSPVYLFPPRILSHSFDTKLSLRNSSTNSLHAKRTVLKLHLPSKILKMQQLK